jgi:hypothetical protein
VSSPGRFHVHSKITQAEVAPKVISESQATETSDKTAPETLEVQMTPSPFSAATRRFEDVSPILSTSQLKKNRRIPSADRSDINSESLGKKKKGYVKKAISKRAR